MPRLPHESNVTPRIVIDDHANMKVAVVVLLNRFDGGCLTGKCNVHYVAAGPRTQPYAAAWSNFDARDPQVLQRLFRFQKLPFPFVHGISSRAGPNLGEENEGRNSRKAP